MTTTDNQTGFLGLRPIKKDGTNVGAIRLGQILKLKHWKI